MEQAITDLYKRVAKNIAFLRKTQNLSQNNFVIEFSNFSGVEYKRSSIAALEENRNKINIHTILMYSQFFKVPIDDIVNKDLTEK